MLVLAFLIVVTGVDPIMVTEFSVIFSVVALPLTYIPILLVANDRAYMRSYANGRVANIFGVFYLVVVLVIAVAAIPLLVLSQHGAGMKMTEIDLGLGVLDHQLMDSGAAAAATSTTSSSRVSRQGNPRRRDPHRPARLARAGVFGRLAARLAAAGSCASRGKRWPRSSRRPASKDRAGAAARPRRRRVRR